MARVARLLAVALTGALYGCPQEVRPLLDGAVATDAASALDATSGMDAGPRDAGPAPDAGFTDAGDPVDAGFADAGHPDASPRPDAGFTPNEPCEPLVLTCLDPARPDVLSVPDELMWADAVSMVQANQILQIRGLRVGAGIRVPPAVTLHGCEGAEITGTIAFSGLGGRVQGFEVTGAIVANQTGAYVVRRNRFVGDANSEPAVAGRSVDALVSASVALIVEQNLFEDRQVGVQASTRYDTMQHEVDIQVRDNQFLRVDAPIRVSEAGLVGRIDATIEHNTFFDFEDAVRLDSVALPTPLIANLFVVGGRAVAGTAPFEVRFGLLDRVTEESQTPPFSGVFAQGPAGFVDAAAGDLRLTAGSAAIDVVPPGGSSSSLDYAGCPRPVGYRGANPSADLGALEAQP